LSEKIVLKPMRVHVKVPEWIAQVVEALSARRNGRRLKFAAYEMK
jgi:hypothetical protein